MKRLWLALWLSIFCLAAGSAWSRGRVVWVALSGEGGAYAEIAAELDRRLISDEVLVQPWRNFFAKGAASPDVIVTVGMEALTRMTESAEAWPRASWVALLVPRSGLEQIGQQNIPRLTGVYLDQPFDRQMQLLRLAMPGRERVGVVLGPTSMRYLKEIHKAVRQAGLVLVPRVVTTRDEVSPALQSVMTDSDVFLAVPDDVVFDRYMAQYVLIASYRRGIPLLGYSAPLVKAGAIAALVSLPAQIGSQGSVLVSRVLSGAALPEVQAPDDYQVMVNSSVARSLDLPMDQATLDHKLHAGKGRP